MWGRRVSSEMTKQLRGSERLIRLDCLFDGYAGCACSHCEASDTIAKLAAERDATNARAERLRVAVLNIYSIGIGAPAYRLGRNIGKAVKIARKALEDDDKQ